MTAPRPVGADGYSRSRFKKALRHFLFGKAFSGLANFTVLILVVRLLAPAEYGAYVALLALQGVVLSWSSFGIEPTVERFLPELRLSRTDIEVTGFVVLGLLVRLITLLLAAAALWMAIGPITQLTGLERWEDVAVSFVLVIVGAGALNTVVSMMDALLLQHLSQSVSAVHAFCRLFPFSLLAYFGSQGLTDVVKVELGAAVAAATIGGCLVTQSVMRRGRMPTITTLGNVLVAYRTRMLRFGGFNYLAQCVMQVYSNDAMRLTITRLLGAVETARFGFISNVIDLTHRYLPAFLLIRLIRPIFVTRYVENRDFEQINAFAILILKLNVFLIVPLVAAAFHGGDFALDFLSGGKYRSEGMLLVCALVLLVPTSHQWVISMTANTIERNELQAKGALLAAIGWPIAVLLSPVVGVWAALAGSYVSALSYNTFAIVYLRREGFMYRQDVRGLIKCVFAGLGAVAAAEFIVPKPVNLLHLVLTGVVVGLTYGVLCFVIKPFTQSERDLLNGILPRKLFVF